MKRPFAPVSAHFRSSRREGRRTQTCPLFRRGVFCVHEAMGLAMAENSVKSVIHRLRRRHGELIREEVAHTVETPAPIEHENRYLLSVVSEEGQ